MLHDIVIFITEVLYNSQMTKIRSWTSRIRFRMRIYLLLCIYKNKAVASSEPHLVWSHYNTAAVHKMSGKIFVFVLFTVISMTVAEPIVIQLQVQDPSSSLNDAIYYSRSLSEIAPKLDSTTTIKSTIATPITSTIKTTTSYSPASYSKTCGVANWLSSKCWWK